MPTHDTRGLDSARHLGPHIAAENAQPHPFSPEAIMARARAYAAERAAKLAARPPRADRRTGPELLASIEAELAREGAR